MFMIILKSYIDHQTNQLFSQTITGDLGGKAKTHEYAAAVIKNL